MEGSFDIWKWDSICEKCPTWTLFSKLLEAKILFVLVKFTYRGTCIYTLFSSAKRQNLNNRIKKVLGILKKYWWNFFRLKLDQPHYIQCKPDTERKKSYNNGPLWFFLWMVYVVSKPSYHTIRMLLAGFLAGLAANTVRV